VAAVAVAVADAIAGRRSERTFEHEKRHSNVAFFLAAMDGRHAGNAGAFSGALRISAGRKSRSIFRRAKDRCISQEQERFAAPDLVKNHRGSN
jgi:hypothetical protein